MNTNAAELRAIQQRMAAAVMQPLTRNETMKRRSATGASMKKEAGAFIRPNDRLSSFERLEIYNRQYWFRLFSSFEEDFPGLKAIVGARRFERLMRAYLEAHPSRSFTLRNLGSSLVTWLHEHPEYTTPKTESAIAIASLEWADIEAFDSQQRTPLSTEEISALNEYSRLELQSYLRLLEAPYAVDDALLAVRDAADDHAQQASNAVSIHLVKRIRSRTARREQIYLAVHRHEDSVYYKRLAREDYQLLKAFDRGASLGEAMEAAFEGSTIPDEERPTYVQSVFQYVMQMGWLCTPRTQEPL
jgi:hypothetical protein